MSIKKRLILLSVFATLVGGAANLLLPSSSANAATAADSAVVRKALLQGLYDQCYVGGEGAMRITDDIGVLDNKFTYKDIIELGINFNHRRIAVPNFLTGNNDKINCRELLEGKGSYSGLYKMAGVTAPINSTNQSEKVAFLDGMGYKPEGDSNGECVAFQFSEATIYYPGTGIADEHLRTTFKICSEKLAGTGDNRTIQSDKLTISTEGGTKGAIVFNPVTEKGQTGISVTCGIHDCRTHYYKVGDNWKTFYTGIFEDISKINNKGNWHTQSLGYGMSSTVKYDLKQNVLLSPSSTTLASYSLSDRPTAGNSAIQYLSNNQLSSVGSLAFSDEEMFAFYQAYLEDFYDIATKCEALTGNALILAESEGYVKTRLYDSANKNVTDCYVKAQKNGESQVYGLSASQLGARRFTGDVELSFAQIAEILNAATNVTTLPDELAEEISIMASASATSPGDPEDTCFTDAGSLGWIICPILDGLAEMIEKAYDSIIEPFLAIDTRLFQSDEDGNNGTFTAWQIFQGFANIAFIILLLVVVFSQITGLGIDNYGIKKVLPKLILAAVAINLSYIICQLAIDVSNILGYGLKQLFDSISAGISTGSSTYSVSGGQSVIVSLVGVLVGGAAIYAFGGWAVILPLLLALLSAAISILFLFVLLGIRQAGVVLLTVLAPVAIVCYMPPNTKPVFDRWRKMFTGLLILFPLCGLLLGAGNMASRILLSASADNFWTGLIAMLITVVPFFFIPTLLRASFAAMGNIGAKMSSLGSKLGSGAAGRIRSSDAYQTKRTASRAAGAARGEGVAQSKLGKTPVGSVLFNRKGQQRSRARAISAADELSQKDLNARSLLQRKEFERMGEKNPQALSQDGLTRQITQSLEDGNMDEAIAKADFAMGRLGASKTASVLREALESVEASNPDFINSTKRRDFLKGVNTRHGQALAKKDFALGRTLSSSGYNSKTGLAESTQSLRLGQSFRLGDIGYGVNSLGQTLDSGGSVIKTGLEAHAMKDEEAATLSKDSIQQMFSAGQIDANMAQRIISDERLRQGMDSETQSMWQYIASNPATVPVGPASPVSRSYAAPPTRVESGTYQYVGPTGGALSPGARVRIHKMSDGTYQDATGATLTEAQMQHFDQKA